MIFTVNFYLKKENGKQISEFCHFLTNEINIRRLQSLQNGLEQAIDISFKIMSN